MKMSRLPTQISIDITTSYEREYKELCDNWISLERKAQLSAGACGALLAGLISFIGGLKTAPTTVTALLLALISMSLLVSALCSLFGLRTSTETLPTPGEKIRAIAWSLKSEDEAKWIQDYIVEAAHKRVVFWDQACKDLFSSNEAKALFVGRSQTFLVVAGVLAAILAGSLLFTSVVRLG